MKKNRVRNPIAHADGGVSEGLEKKIDASKLKEGSIDYYQARKKLKAMFEDFKSKIKTCEMPKLAYYKRIGYGSAADYRGFGQQIWDIPYEPTKRDPKYWDITQSKNFATNAAWEQWSEGYYPQIMANLYNNFNEFFTIYYPQRVLEIAETTDKEEKTKKENELKEYLQNTLLNEYIKSIIREGKEDYQNIFDCIKTFVLHPQQVLEHQFNYVNEVERQEGTNAAAMKSYANEKHIWLNTGNFCQTIDAINYMYSNINSYNRVLYQKALSLLNNRGFSEVLDDNIVIAHNFIKSFETVDVGITISQDYTDNVATADINQTGLQYGSGGNKSTTSDKNMLLIGIALLGVLFFIKKKKK